MHALGHVVHIQAKLGQEYLLRIVRGHRFYRQLAPVSRRWYNAGPPSTTLAQH